MEWWQWVPPCRRAVLSLLVAWGALVGAPPASSQILNTLRGSESEEPGRSGTLSAFYSATGGNTENVQLSGAARVQWRGSTHRWSVLVDGGRTRAAGTTTAESAVTHLRHNARLAQRFESVAFAQHQHDPFQRLTARYLVGVGVRWEWLRADRLEGAWGVTPMLEAEQVEGESTEVGGRLSTFVSVLGHLDDRTRLDLTAFVQPKPDRWDDVRAVASGSLEFAISGRISLIVQGSLGYDSKPADRVKETDWKTRTGLSLEL